MRDRLAADPERLNAMRVAIAFGEPDVDAFLDAITHEQLVEWVAFFTVDPQGWTATNLLAGRLAWVAAQTQTRKPLDEGDFRIRMRGDRSNAPSEAFARAQQEVLEIRSEIERVGADEWLRRSAASPSC